MLYGVYIARFPFIESSKDKLRPVVVLSRPYSKHKVVTVVPISSKQNAEAINITISDLAIAGLIRPSIARIYRLGTLLQTNLITQLGSLSDTDIRKLQVALRKLLNL